MKLIRSIFHRWLIIVIHNAQSMKYIVSTVVVTVVVLVVAIMEDREDRVVVVEVGVITNVNPLALEKIASSLL